MITFLFFFLVTVTSIFFVKGYKSCAYYQVTKNSYLSVIFDKGRHLEYLTYKSLSDFERKGGKFLFNIHVPKWNGETTEVDLLLICSRGLFVFECKNFSGWIFGNEVSKTWTQVLPVGKGRSYKSNFYNPIMQNASHIRHLKRLIGTSVPMRSIIVFSDRCEFKDVTVYSDQITLTKYSSIASSVRSTCKQMQDVYTVAEINTVYSKLYPYTQV